MVELVLLLAFGSLFPASVAGGDSGFDWPIDLPPALSSTFGETRSTAFHAGIDVKTWGRTGYAVKAIGDGCVWRLRTSPWGYGRAVYQKLEDGRIAVYAHLSGFAPRLAERVEAAQQEAGRYSVDLWFEEGELPLQRGERIGWTGCSGAGPPHLHLELRDAQNAPINPLLNGFEVEDGIPPTLRGVALFPQGMGSRVEGRDAPLSIGLRWDGKRKIFSVDRPVQVYGRIGVGLLAYDRADAAPNKLAPYYTRLFVDGRPVFSCRFDRFSYSDAHQIYLDRSRLPFGRAFGDFFHLFRLPGNRLGFYEGGDGFLACGRKEEGRFLSRGLHRVEVMAGDVAGNQSRARLSLQVDALPFVEDARVSGGMLECRIGDPDDSELEVELACSDEGRAWTLVEKRRRAAAGRIEWRLDRSALLWRVRVRDRAGEEDFETCARIRERGNAPAPVLEVVRTPHPGFVALALQSNQVLAAAPRVQVAGRDLEVRQRGLKDYEIEVPLRAGGPDWVEVRIEAIAQSGARAHEVVRLSQRMVRPDEGRRLEFDGGRAELVFPEGCAYAPFFPQVEPFSSADAGELLSAGRGYVLAPDGLSFDQKVEVRFRYPEEIVRPEKLGIYRPSGAGDWALIGNEVDVRARQVCAVVRRFSPLVLMVDETPPSIWQVYPAPGSRIRIKRPRLSARIEDRGSGIGREEDVVMELDGRRLISEYDPDGKKVEYLVRQNLEPGAHRLVVRVRDMSGNEREVESEFTVE